MKDIVISIEEQSALFKKHLQEQDNERIIFSAPFGAGKTYFLREFFEESAAQYLTVKLAPVNYSIASNEDIFKLIKFDILFELLAHHGITQPGKIKIRRDIFYSLKFPEKAITFFTSIAGFLGTLNKDVKEATDVIVALEAIRAQVSDFASLSPEIEESPEISAFLKQMLDAYHREADDVTLFIENSLNQLVSAEEGQESQIREKVLVIDDLDRLDPEHIFRLFNVFSAHFDYNYSSKNKFGFDKVIFVCDIQNIRNLFHSRYGGDTDFSGYIDKFFSHEVFHFNNTKAVKSYVETIIGSVPIKDNETALKNYFVTYVLQRANYSEKGLAYYILFELIVSGALKPRRIYSPRKTWTFPEGIIDVPGAHGMRKVYINTVPTITTILLLTSILGGGNQLLTAIKHAATQPRSEEFLSLEESPTQLQNLMGSLLIMDYWTHRFKTHNGNYQQSLTHTYTHPGGRTIEYEVVEGGNRRDMFFSIIKNNSRGITFFELLPILVERLLQDKIIQ
jgi:hypothetical protein